MPKGWVHWLVSLGLYATLAVPFYAAARNKPLETDEGIFASMAWASESQGIPLYQAGVDNKPPGIFWLYQLAQAYDQAGVARVRVLQGVLVFFCALLLRGWIGAVLSATAGLIAGLVFLLLACYEPGIAADTEVPMACGALLGFLLLFRGLSSPRPLWFVLSGVVLAGAVLFKQVAVADNIAALVVIYLLTRRGGVGRTWSCLGWYLAGVALVALPVLLWVGATRQASEFLYAVLFSIRDYHSGSLRIADKTFLDSFVRRDLLYVQGPLCLAIVALAPRLAHRYAKEALGFGVWLAWAAAGWAAAGTFFGHQMTQFYAPLAALAGLASAALWKEAEGLRPAVRYAGLVVLLLIVLAPLADRYRVHLLIYQRAEWRDAQAQLAEWVQRNTFPSEPVYTTTNAGLYALSQRRAASPYFHLFLSPSGSRWQRLLSDLQQQQPAVAELERTPWLPGQEVRVAKLERLLRGAGYVRAQPRGVPPLPGPLWFRPDVARRLTGKLDFGDS